MYDIMETVETKENVLQCILMLLAKCANCDFATNPTFVAVGKTRNQSQ